ncbi:helix-turn-helix domain-containing protein [Jannaschia formosa]|uniref:helix-turn-helix domain-containing protein n=1 Tax=Jannaschia formosa TaxID=2259592 RepID=UPI000E1BD0B0|nr:helix-turn-helix domain-containing protein [Jannaschia formosa]TFL16197.1 transcriptional regulator [Jannaschia formosa]
MSGFRTIADRAASEAPGVSDARLFGEMIRARRSAQGLRQEDLARATGVGRRYIVELEGGKPTLRIGPALMIARFLGIVPSLPDERDAATDEDLPDMLPDDSDDLPPSGG